jgi:hypothetical protein
MSPRLAAVLFLPLLAACAPAQEGAPAAAPTDAPTGTPSDFVRFVAVGQGGHLDTAITTYRKGEVVVVFYAAVHIADEACYEALNDRFTTCDALLYELVAPADTRPDRDRETGLDPLSMLQRGMRNMLGLSFQLDVIDYQPGNFVHADMTPQEFAAAMEERGESLLSIMFEMMQNGMELQREKAEAEREGEAKPAEFDLVKAFRSREGRHALRMMLAPQLEEIELLAAGAKANADGEDGSALLEGRNEKCLEVLQREIAGGRQRLGIYYGAAHLPHLERRLVADLGFAKTGHEWLVAWDCTPRQDPRYDRELVRQRRQCGQELAVLAQAARDHRRRTGGAPVTVRELAAAQHDGAPCYAGPLQDPWGNDYVVEKRRVGTRWQVKSKGQDGQPDTDDDLVAQEPRGGGQRWF